MGWSSLILFRFKQTEGVDSVQQCCQHVWNNEKLHFCLFCIGRAQSNWSSKFQNPPTVQYEDSSCTHSVLSVTLRLRPSQVSMININPDLGAAQRWLRKHSNSTQSKLQKNVSDLLDKVPRALYNLLYKISFNFELPGIWALLSRRSSTSLTVMLTVAHSDAHDLLISKRSSCVCASQLRIRTTSAGCKLRFGLTWVKCDRGRLTLKRDSRKEISQIPQPTVGESD